MHDDRGKHIYFLTWTTYGTWLPGDARGYVSNTLKEGRYARKQNHHGEPFAREDVETRERAAALQKGKTVWLTQDLASVAANSFLDSAVQHQWQMTRAAIMPNHVHLLVTECSDTPSNVLRVFKGRSQAALSKHCGKPQRWWTRSGSQRWILDEDALKQVMAYIEEQPRILCQIRNGVLQP